jgi:hypothetical protein
LKFFIDGHDEELEHSGEEDVNATTPRTYGSLMIEKLTGDIDGRIDFMLQVWYCSIMLHQREMILGIKLKS